MGENRYKGIVAKSSDGSCFLFFEQKKNKLSNGMPITDSQKIYESLTEKQISLCVVEFCDGTIARPFESFQDTDNMFMRIKDIVVLSIFNEREPNKTSLEAIEEDGDEIAEYFFNNNELYGNN